MSSLAIALHNFNGPIVRQRRFSDRLLSSSLAVTLAMLSVFVAMPIMVGCNSAPWAVTLMNQIVIGTVGAINLAAVLKHTVPDQALITKVQDLGNGFIKAYTDWEAAAPNLKPGVWAKVQEAMTLIQTDLPPILNGLGVTDSAYLAIINFVISEVLSLANTIMGTTSMKASVALHKGVIGKAKMLQENPHLDPNKFKAGYNDRMRSAGHPEFQIK